MSEIITTRDACLLLGVTEPALRHVLRRQGAPRPQLHPTARLFLWTEQDIERLVAFLERHREREGGRDAGR